MASEAERTAQESALKALFSLMPEQSSGESAQNPTPAKPQITPGSSVNPEFRMVPANDWELFPQQRTRLSYAGAAG
jgi:hypothetical protein